MESIRHEELDDEDDVELGYLVSEGGRVFPIVDCVASVLRDSDIPRAHYGQCLDVIEPLKDEADVDSFVTMRQFLCDVNATDGAGIWNQEEMEYYDKEVATPALRGDFLERIKSEPLWHIFLERARWLVDRCDILSRGSMVLEVGCGNARSIRAVARPADRGLSYVGTDISWRRLLLARQAVPEGDFVQASALCLPFRRDFEVVLAFGVVHHLPDQLAGLSEALSKLRPGGELLLHEPIDKPQLLPEVGIRGRLRSMLEGYEHSDHDNEIDWEMVVGYCKDRGVNIRSQHFAVSILRTVLSKFLQRTPMRSSLAVWKLLLWVDGVFLRLFCAKHNAFGPATVMAILKPN